MAGHVNRSSLLRIDAICKQVGIYSGGSSSSGFFNSNLSVDLLADGDVYQFGVYEGLSLRTISRIVHPLRLFAFDSIAGLPEDTHDELKIDKWAPGTFETTRVRVADAFDVWHFGPDRTLARMLHPGLGREYVLIEFSEERVPQ